MTFDEKAAKLTLVVAGDEDSDSEELDALTRTLLRDVLEAVDVEDASLASGGEIPKGAKSGAAFSLGSLAVSLLPAVLPKMVEFLQSWVLRGKGRNVKIKLGDLEVEFDPSATSADQLSETILKLKGAMGS